MDISRENVIKLSNYVLMFFFEKIEVFFKGEVVNCLF
jgi:hypothetical protein